ncbi:hypothetical protein ACXZ1K_07610 [Pedobacter sp. PWIIR3]
MKHYFSGIIVLCLLLAQGCKQEGSYTIKGAFNLPDGAMVTLWPDDHYHQIAGTPIKDNQWKLNVEGLDEGVYDLLVTWPDPNFAATKIKNGSFLSTPDSLRSNLYLYLESGSDYELSCPVKDYTTVYAPTTANPKPFPLAVVTESVYTKDLHLMQSMQAVVTLAYQKKLDSLDVLVKGFLAKNDDVNYGKAMSEYQGLEKNFYEKERFKTIKRFIDTHKASAVSAYLIATAPNLKQEKAYFAKALAQLDPKLKDSRYAKEARRRIAL